MLNFLKKYGKAIGIYGGWVAFHLVLLFFASRSTPVPNNKFWPFSIYEGKEGPFSMNNLGIYDFTEFLIYVFLPFAFFVFLLLAMKILNSKSDFQG